MKRNYHIFIFEKFPDGSSLWRACVSRRCDLQRKMLELKDQSENEFFAIDIVAGEVLAMNPSRGESRQEFAMHIEQVA